jgi:ribosomal protein S18 acetylase RimI-like enzyme
MNEIIIRPSVETDFPTLIELNHVIWNETNTPATIHFDSVTDYGNHCPPGSQFVAVIENRVAGYVGYKNPTGLPANSHVLEIDIGVHPDFQKQSVGKKLIDYIAAWGEKNGYLKMSIRVLETNPNAITFYKTNGFLEQGRLIDEFYINGQFIDDLLMYKELRSFLKDC